MTAAAQLLLQGKNWARQAVRGCYSHFNCQRQLKGNPVTWKWKLPSMIQCLEFQIQFTNYTNQTVAVPRKHEQDWGVQHRIYMLELEISAQTCFACCLQVLLHSHHWCNPNTVQETCWCQIIPADRSDYGVISHLICILCTLREEVHVYLLFKEMYQLSFPVVHVPSLKYSRSIGLEQTGLVEGWN